jgi:hypothetical protein
VFKPNEIPGNAEQEEDIQRILEEPLQLASPIKFFTPSEIKRIII